MKINLNFNRKTKFKKKQVVWFEDERGYKIVAYIKSVKKNKFPKQEYIVNSMIGQKISKSENELRCLNEQ